MRNHNAFQQRHTHRRREREREKNTNQLHTKWPIQMKQNKWMDTANQNDILQCVWLVVFYYVVSRSCKRALELIFSDADTIRHIVLRMRSISTAQPPIQFVATLENQTENASMNIHFDWQRQYIHLAQEYFFFGRQFWATVEKKKPKKCPTKKPKNTQQAATERATLRWWHTCLHS